MLQVLLSEVVKDHNSSSASGGSSSSCDGDLCLVPMLNAPLMDAEESQVLLQGPAAAAAALGLILHMRCVICLYNRCLLPLRFVDQPPRACLQRAVHCSRVHNAARDETD